MAKRRYLTEKQEAVYREIERASALWFHAYQIAAQNPLLGRTEDVSVILRGLVGNGLLELKRLTREEAAHHLHYGTVPLDAYRLKLDHELDAAPPKRYPWPR